MTNYVTANRVHMTWDEMVTKVANHGPSESQTADGGIDPEWWGGTFDQALAMATTGGYQSAIPAVDDIVRYLDTDLGQSTSPTFEAFLSVAGGEIDMGRFLSGDPECMITAMPMQVMRTGRIVSLYIPVSTEAGMSAEVIMARGAACVALVDAFSRLQHPMEIWVGLCNRAITSRGKLKGTRNALMVKVQDATQPLDMGRVMFAIAHPGMPRSLGFALKETCPANIRKAFGFTNDGGYGAGPRTIQDDDTVSDMEHSIILPELKSGARERWTDTEWVKGWIHTQLERITAG